MKTSTLYTILVRYTPRQSDAEAIQAPEQTKSIKFATSTFMFSNTFYEELQDAILQNDIFPLDTINAYTVVREETIYLGTTKE